MRRAARRQTEEPVSNDRWLVSYSDFITLLFAFFVVLFATQYRDNQAIKKLSQAIHTGFQEMGTFSGADSNTFRADTSVTNQPLRNAKTGQDGVSAVDIIELRKQLESAIGQELKKHEVVMRATPEGFTISLNELGFFNSGQAVLLPGAAEKIERIARVLMTHGLELRVEGHSDDQPIHNAQFGSNWELSTARAMAVLGLLLNDAGFDPKRISVAGYAQYRPVADDTTPEGRRMNRRVDLVVVAMSAPLPRTP